MNYLALSDEIKSLPDKKIDKAFINLAGEMEDELLLLETIPSDAFDFLISLFSDERVACGKSLSAFIWLIYGEFHKLSESQKNKILDVVIENHEKYQDKLTRFSAADFISRKYPNHLSLEKFRQIAGSDKEVSRHFAFDGLDVLRIKGDVDPVIKERVVALQDFILKSFKTHH